MICFSICSPVAWVVTSEIFPLKVRGVSVSITTAANWVGNFVVAMLTPILIASPLGIHGTFYLLSAMLLTAFLFVALALPETKVASATGVQKYVSHEIVLTGTKSGKNWYIICSFLEGENTNCPLLKVNFHPLISTLATPNVLGVGVHGDAVSELGTNFMGLLWSEF